MLSYLNADAAPVTEGQTAYWPSPSVLTARLRRLITASQRYTKSRQILQIHQTQAQSQSQQTMVLSAPLCPLPPTLNDTLNPKMAAKIERQQRSEQRLMVIQQWINQNVLDHLCSRVVNMFLLSKILPRSGGPGERKLTSIALSPLLVLFLTQTWGALTGPNSGRWLDCTRKPTRAYRNTYAPSPPCVDGCVVYHLKREVRSLIVCSHKLTQTMS